MKIIIHGSLLALTLVISSLVIFSCGSSVKHNKDYVFDAAMNNDSNFIKLYITKGSAVNAEDTNSSSLLMIAAQYGNSDIIIDLITCRRRR